MKKALRVLLVIWFVLTILATLMCGFDCIIAHRDEAPTFLFSFLLPVLQEEFIGGGRLDSLVATVALPWHAVSLPLGSVLLAILVRWQADVDSRWRTFGRVTIVVSSAFFLINLYSVYTIYRTFTSI